MRHKSIMLGGQLLHGTDHFGEWFTTGLEGWYEPPSVRSTDAERALTHGDHTGVSTYAARTPTIDGLLLLREKSLGITAMAALNQIASLRPTDLTVSEGGVTQTAKARLAGLDWTWETPEAIRFQLRLACPDPRKYGGWQAPVSIGQATAVPVFHRGNAEARPLLRLSGDAPTGYTITHEGTGRIFEVYAALPPTWVHVVDMSTGRVYRQGQIVDGYGVTQTLSIAPGPPQLIRLRVRGAADGSVVGGTVHVQDTWI